MPASHSRRCKATTARQPIQKSDVRQEQEESSAIHIAVNRKPAQGLVSGFRDRGLIGGLGPDSDRITPAVCLSLCSSALLVTGAGWAPKIDSLEVAPRAG